MEVGKKRKVHYTCRQCDTKFSRRTSLYYHQVNEHTINKKLCCRVCGKKVSGRGPLTNHLKLHTQSAALTAAQHCKKKLLNSRNADWKKEIVEGKIQEALKCNVCLRTFSYRRRWLNHMQMHGKVKKANRLHSSASTGGNTDDSQPKKSLKYRCAICDRVFETSIACHNHKRWHKRNASKMPASGFYAQKNGMGYRCAICALKFTTKLGIARHSRLHKHKLLEYREKSGVQLLVNNQYKCSSCKLEFTTEQGLAEHRCKPVQFPQTTWPQKKFKCKYCGMKFTTNDRLNNHMKIHKLGRFQKSRATRCEPVMCKICGWECRSSQELMHHAKVHDNENDAVKCNRCGIVCKSSQGLQLHARWHDGENNSLKCKVCDVECKSRHGLLLHSRIHNNENDALKCRNCGMECKSSHGLLLHSRYHHDGSNIFKCHKCGLECKSSGGLLYHSRKHSDESNAVMCKSIPGLVSHSKMRENKNDVLTCNKCGLECKSSHGLFVHCSKMHNNAAKCNKCGLECKSSHGLLVHCSKMHNNESDAVKCNKCGVECKSNHGLLVHHAIVHNKEVDSFKCLQCNMVCKSGSGLLRHSAIHDIEKDDAKVLESIPSSTSQEVYNCAECLTVFISKTGFDRHCWSHSGLRLHECNECGIGFLQKAHLEKHFVCHQSNGQYKCTLCTARYALKRGLKQHMVMHKYNNRGSVTCKHCKFLFHNRDVLQRHIKARHTSKQKYGCNVCSAQFKKDLHLKQHMQLHDQQLNFMCLHQTKSSKSMLPVNHISITSQFVKNQKVIACEICDRHFAYACSLRYHMQNSHQKFCCGVCRKFVDSQNLSNATGLLHKYVCISCHPSEQKNHARSLGVHIPFCYKNASIAQLVVKLLYQLVDEEVLKSKGWLKKPAHQQLEAVVKLCGQEPVKTHSVEEDMMENLKLLFALSVGEDATTTLLQFKPVKDILFIMLSSET